MQDPAMRTVLQDMQTNPHAARSYVLVNQQLHVVLIVLQAYVQPSCASKVGQTDCCWYHPIRLKEIKKKKVLKLINRIKKKKAFV